MSAIELPSFPVDDSTLLALEHAMGALLTYERPNAADGDGPWLVGADYSMSALLDFIGGTVGDDPNEEVVQEARDESDLPPWERGGMHNARIVYDSRSHFTERDVIQALITEVRRLRACQMCDRSGEGGGCE